MTADATARAALAEAEQRVLDADKACADAEIEFKRAPSGKGHGVLAVATQLAANAHSELEAARAVVAGAERDDVVRRMQEAAARAQTATLFEKVEPVLARIRELHAELVTLAGVITAACTEQAQAVHEAKELARSIGVSAPVPIPIKPTFFRAMVGIRIARDVYTSGARWVRGLEPVTFAEPRPALPSGHHAENEWRAARKLALPADEFLPGARYDLGMQARNFFHAERGGEVIDV
jgi:hypothetical protein